MENSSQNNGQVSYELVNDSQSSNDNNIIILMENTSQDNKQMDNKVDNDSENENTKRPKINSKKISSPKKGQRQEEKIIPKIPLMKEEDKLNKKEEKISPRSPRKRDAANRKYNRKNAKKNIVQKKRRGGEEIKVVGKVSAKLSSLIERLQQNTISSKNKVNTQFEGDKVVMAPRIKAALEKFNKKKQEQPQIIHTGKPYRRYYHSKDDRSSKGEREEGSTINYEEEEEYEEDEDYEEEDEEEEEEEEKGHQRKHQPSIKKRKKKDISNDGDSTSEKKKRKRKKRKRKRRDISDEEEDENDDEVEYEYDENGKRRRKRKRKKRKKKNNDIIEEESSEYEDSEEEEEEDEDEYTIDKKTGKKIKKSNINSNDISDDKSSDKGKNISIRKRRGISTHKSGRGTIIEKNKNLNDPDNSNISNADKTDNNDDDDDDRFPIVRNKKRGISTHKSGRGKVMVKTKDKNDPDNSNISNADKTDNNDDDDEDRFSIVRNKKRGISTHKSGRGKVMVKNKDKDDLNNADNNKDNNDENNNESTDIRRSMTKHKSGHAKTIIRNNNKKNDNDDEGGNGNNDKKISDSDDSSGSSSSSSDDDSEIKKTIINKKRGVSRHKSGRGKVLVKDDENKNDTNQNNSDQNQSEEIPKEQEEFLIRTFGAIKNGSFLLVRKVPVKVVMFERFAQNYYTITNYKSKVNGQRIMKELKKYMPCKQTDFILYASYDPEYEEFIKQGGKILKRKAISSTIRKNKLIKKPLLNKPLNLKKPINDKNDTKKSMNDLKKKNTYNADNDNNNQNEDPDPLKSYLNKMSNNDFDNKNIKKKLFDIQQLKTSLKNEMNEQLNKKRRRHQSIILTNYLDIYDFTNKNRNSNRIINDKGALKNTKNLGNKPNDNTNKVKSTKMNVNEIVKKRGLDANNKDSAKVENIDTDINEAKKVKFDLFRAKKPKLGNKNQVEAEEEEVQINDDGVKYLIFEFRNDLKMIYRKAKWKLAKSNRISIFLKAVKPNKYKDSPKKKNNKVYFNVDENEKNDDMPEKIYKRKGDNFKLVKGSLKKKINKNKYMYPIENNKSSASEESEDKNNKNKESRNNKGKDVSNIKLYYDLFKSYDSEKKDNDLFKSINSNSISNDEKDKYMTHKNKYSVQNDYIDDYLNNYYNRRENKRFTARPKRMRKNKDYEFEENSKNINKVKSKKAKIRKFKSHRDNFDTENKEKPIRGFLYDYIHNKRNRILYIDNNIRRKMKSNAHLDRSENVRKRNNNENYFNYDTFNKTNYSDARGSRKHSRTMSTKRNKNKLKKVKYENESENNKKKNSANHNNNRTNNSNSKYNNNYYNSASAKNEKGKYINAINNPNYYNSASAKNEKSKYINAINNPGSKYVKKRKITEDNADSKLSIPKLNNSQYKFPRKNGFDSYFKKNNIHNLKNGPKNFHTISMPAIPKQNYKKKKVKVSREESGIDAVKSKFKIKLIEINDELLDAIHYYKGPIDITCISSKNYVETVEDLNKKVLKNGFKCIKSETNYFKFSNGINSFLVEIVKIRNNMLYYLVLKNQWILNFFIVFEIWKSIVKI